MESKGSLSLSSLKDGTATMQKVVKPLEGQGLKGSASASWELYLGGVGPEMNDSSGDDKEGESVFESGV